MKRLLRTENLSAAFKQKVLSNEVNNAHATALRANKLGKKLVSKTVQMAESGESSRRLRSTSVFLNLNKIDTKSTTLALDAELEAQGVDIKARVVPKWEGDMYDPNTTKFLELTEIAGEPVEVQPNQFWRETDSD